MEKASEEVELQDGEGFRGSGASEPVASYNPANVIPPMVILPLYLISFASVI